MNVLLSIRPRYVEEIMNGNKKYEFRKSIFRCRDLEVVYIYATSPMKKIVGAFKISDIIEDHPVVLWKKFKEFSGIDKESFFNYFGAKKRGFAIEIGKVGIFEDPIDPFREFSDFKQPQSFYYIDENLFSNSGLDLTW